MKISAGQQEDAEEDYREQQHMGHEEGRAQSEPRSGCAEEEQGASVGGAATPSPDIL